jgi:hypothetical protein
MLCIWWDIEGIIHYELLERNLTDTAAACQQLPRLEKQSSKIAWVDDMG